MKVEYGWNNATVSPFSHLFYAFYPEISPSLALKYSSILCCCCCVVTNTHYSYTIPFVKDEILFLGCKMTNGQFFLLYGFALLSCNRLSWNVCTLFQFMMVNSIPFFVWECVFIWPHIVNMDERYKVSGNHQSTIHRNYYNNHIHYTCSSMIKEYNSILVESKLTFMTILHHLKHPHRHIYR